MTNGATAVVVRLSDAAAAEVPPAVRAMAKLCMLDWFGLAIAGLREPVAELLLAEVQTEGATPAATILGMGKLFSGRQAALVHGVAGHALDFDDVHLAMHVHPTTVILPPLLALAEMRRLSGDAVLRAFVAGYEAAGMIGAALSGPHYARGFHATGTIGAMGAAVGCAHVLGLDAPGQARALGLAASMAAGLKAQFGTMAKPMHAGRAAEAGLLAALRAERGVTGSTTILEGSQGFADTQAEGWPADAPVWSGYHLLDNRFKFHAACFGVHGTLEAIGALRRAHAFAAGDVKAVRLTVHPDRDAMCNLSDPRDGNAAKFSLRFNAALALAGRATAIPATYTDAVVIDSELRRLHDRAAVTLAEGAWPEDMTAVDVELHDGRTLRETRDMAKQRLLPDATATAVAAKFDALAGPRIGAAAAGHLRAAIDRFEDHPVTALLAMTASLR
ncbi:MmgE/PrpD family protein [Sphingomonas abaci]|uniref:2-methylcitrate dehydratase PrpD n=1 Tax=Sphingomonas abaci TaxID=237611 RepID=A0A7W7EWH5_9SPHN|nr:MmgE/PrpD family protein [Sphingomonas abaci]MBB4616081.1 2-methylcitrate dehydratase PrpD [Sphingomonas abaci]